MPAYPAVQQQLLAIFGRFTDQSSRSRSTRPSSMSPADVASSAHRRRSPPRSRSVRDELPSCSIGIGPTKLLAKLAAELHKPGGVRRSAEDVHGRLRAFRCKLSGIGRSPRIALRAMGSPRSASPGRPPSCSPAPFPAARHAQGAAFGGATGRSRRSCAAQVRRPRGDLRRDIDDPELLHATLLDLADRGPATCAARAWPAAPCLQAARRTFTPSARSGPCGSAELRQRHLRDRHGPA